MNKKEVIMALGDLPTGDSEAAHSLADDYILEFLSDNGFKDVADAWQEAESVCTFWYA